MWNRLDETIHLFCKKTRYNQLCLLGSAASLFTDQRVVTISPNNDPKQTIFPNNRIVTRRYTVWNFVPKNLFEQFMRVANFYFLVMTLVSLTINSPISPVTSVLPLSFVILVTACKQAYEDYLRYVQDRRENTKTVTVIRNKCAQTIYCEQVVVGDLVKVQREENVPCDILLLFSTDESESCYVTTSNLDGETNLKTVLVPKSVTKMSTSQVASMEATVTCQHPSSDLYSFHGKLDVTNGSSGEGTSGHLTIHNLLLRGSKLKDTDYIIGCALYTGHDTKLSLNSKIRSCKLSTSEKSINRHIIIFMVLLLAEVLESCMLNVIIQKSKKWPYLGLTVDISFKALVNDFLNFTVLYNYLVPISLYVTIELQKFLSSLFFSWDTDMYDEATDQPALTNTSDLNEELGQIEYLFADKTGTLTENLMVFRRCSINGKTYMEKDCDGNLYLLPSSGNENEAVKLTTWEPEIWHFMVSLALCHSVQISPPSHRPDITAKRIEFRESFRQKKITKVDSTLLMSPELPEYQAASADEKALVEASARCGVIFERSTNDMIQLKIGGDGLTYEKLEVLEFTSERKRMSVIVRDTAGDFWLYCKGADSTMFPLIVSESINDAIIHVADFSMRGFRTLVIGYKKMDQMEYDELAQKVEQARQIIGMERATYMERAYEKMESGLTLLGVTAVEDRLQDDVQETLECLQVAGIKIWVLTGDKAETAENIAFLCGQFKTNTEILRLLDVNEDEICAHRLLDFERRMKLEPYNQYGLLVDGHSIATALKTDRLQFRSIAMACDAVVCCRLTPLQKSEIVRLVKTAYDKPHTAAIGDGGNDVSMIQEAHVGIGIMGKEGRQATMSSDFAIAKFKFLKKAILVHGHWFYVRISTLAQYFFYKNFVFITPQLLFNAFCGFSTQTLYDALYLMFFNVLFASLPIFVYGLFEQNYTAKQLLNNPHLYKLYQRNYLLSGRQFFLWTITACWHTVVIYFTTYILVYINPVILYNRTPMEQWSFGTCIAHLVTLVANLQVLVRSSHWNVLLILTVVLSEVVLFIFLFVQSSVYTRYDGDMLKVFHILTASPQFWFLTIFVVTTCLIPDYLIMTYNAYRPARILRRNEEQPRYSTSNDNSENVPLRTMNQKFFNLTPWKRTFKVSINE